MRRLIAVLGALAILSAACGTGDDVGSAGPVTTGPGAVGPVTTTTTPPTTVVADPGTPTQTTTTTTTIAEPASGRFVDVFMIKDAQHMVAVTRAVPATPDIAANAIRALITGPTPSEVDIGLSGAVPEDTLLLGLTINDGLATIDLSREFEAGGGSFAMLSRLAQVVYTLTEFPTVDAVLFHLDGRPVSTFSGEGIILEDPVTRADYVSLLPLEPVKPARVLDQADLPPISGVPTDELSRVVLVAADDVLNVRTGPGVDNPILGKLPPGTVIRRTGAETAVGQSTWVEIDTGAEPGWVNDHFLGAVVSGADFAEDARVMALIDEMTSIMASRGDLSTIASERGIYIAHHSAPVRFDPTELKTALSDTTKYRWPSNALAPNDPEIPERTFAEAIADSFVSTYDDPDTSTTVNVPIEGGNGRLPQDALPFELRGFNYIGIHDPGDNSDHRGIDWSVWYVSIDYEDAEPVVIGLTIDQWAP